MPSGPAAPLAESTAATAVTPRGEASRPAGPVSPATRAPTSAKSSGLVRERLLSPLGTGMPSPPDPPTDAPVATGPEEERVPSPDSNATASGLAEAPPRCPRGGPAVVPACRAPCAAATSALAARIVARAASYFCFASCASDKRSWAGMSGTLGPRPALTVAFHCTNNGVNVPSSSVSTAMYDARGRANPSNAPSELPDRETSSSKVSRPCTNCGEGLTAPPHSRSPQAAPKQPGYSWAAR